MKTDGRRYYKSKARREIAKVYLRTSTVNLRLELFSLASRSFVSIRGLENSFPLNEISQPHIVHYRFYLPDQLHGQSSRPHSDFWRDRQSEQQSSLSGSQGKLGSRGQKINC